MTNYQLFQNDLPEEVLKTFKTSASIDTETLGLNINRDRLCLIQIMNNDDVLNTRVLKHVGYEGVDLRWTDKDGFNDGRANVGSVIFDLKPGTVSEVNIG